MLDQKSTSDCREVINGQLLLHLHHMCTYHSKNLYPTARASLTHSSAVRCGPLSDAADDADAGMNPTLYVPNPLVCNDVVVSKKLQ